MPAPLRMMWRYAPEDAHWCASPATAPGEEVEPRASRAPEVYLIAARKDQQLGLVLPEQLTPGLIEIQSTADYRLYVPVGWEVAKVQDCHFVPHGPPRLVPCQQRCR